MKVKVCGITNLEDALLCESLGADALGFVFYKKSKRYISPVDAAKIANTLSPLTMKVGVFVDESTEAINKISSVVKLNAVQLHNDNGGSSIKEISSPVIRAFRIKDDFDFNILEKLDENYFLLDTFSQNEMGGTGKSFDWKLIPKQMKHKIILAGGISSSNIDFICQNVKPAAVDLSSSLEMEPGKKDMKKVKEFFNKFNKYRSNKWSS
ncbi:MAG: phosphoribosylanthranilate isomerase [Ignavibacteriaceae bacterium]